MNDKDAIETFYLGLEKKKPSTKIYGKIEHNKIATIKSVHTSTREKSSSTNYTQKPNNSLGTHSSNR